MLLYYIALVGESHFISLRCSLYPSQADKFSDISCKCTTSLVSLAGYQMERSSDTCGGVHLPASVSNELTSLCWSV